MYCFPDFLAGKNIIGHGIFQPAPEFFYFIQVRTIWRQNTIFPSGYRDRRFFRNRRETSVSYFFMFVHTNMSCFIVQTVHEFHPFVFSVSQDDLLFSFQETGLLDSLVIPEHRSIFKQDCGDNIIQKFFEFSNVFQNCSCFSKSDIFRVYIDLV